MKKIIFVAIIGQLLGLASFSQSLRVGISRYFGGSGSEGDPSQTLTDNRPRLIATKDGGYLMGLSSNSTDGDMTGSKGSADVWLLKLSQSGIVQWKRNYGGSLADQFIRLAGAKDGYYFVANTVSTDGDLSVTPAVSKKQAWLVKIDFQGNILWQKRTTAAAGDNVQETAYDVTVSAENIVFVALGLTDATNSNCGLGTGYEVRSYDSSGNMLKSYKSATCSNNARIKKLIVNSFGEVYGIGYKGFDLTLRKSYMAVKFSSQLSRIWEKTYSVITNDEGSAETGLLLGDSGLVIMGNSRTPTLSQGLVGFERLDTAGNLKGSTSIIRTGERLSDVVRVSPTNFTVLMSSSYLGGDTGLVRRNHGGQDLVLVTLNNNLAISNSYDCVGGSNNEIPGSIIYNSDSSYTVSASSTSSNGDLPGNYGGEDAWFAKLQPLSNVITGRIFLDANRNGVKDGGESFISTLPVASRKGNTSTTISTWNGLFVFNVDTGSFYTKPLHSLPYHTILPDSQLSVFAAYNLKDSINFALQPIPGMRDLRVSLLAITPSRPGFGSQYRIIVDNVGTDTVATANVILKRDARAAYSSADIPPNISNDTLRWTLASLIPGQQRSINVLFTLAAPPALQAGDTLEFRAEGSSSVTDQTPANNSAVARIRATGSYDPNDKAETNGGIYTPQQLDRKDFLIYTIRFQNTGNDTAFTVVLKDTLDARIDWSSIEPVAASHPYTLSIKNGNAAEIRFENILLPDSNRNESASHGFVSYRVKPKAGVVLGDTLRNTASIYFDFNLPINTNTVVTVVKLLPPPVPLVSSVPASLCRAGSARTFRLLNLPDTSLRATVVVKIDNTVAAVGTDSTFILNPQTLAVGTHTLNISYSNTTASRQTNINFTIAEASTPDVNLSTNIATVVNLTDPVVLTAANAAGGGAQPRYTFAKDRSFTQVVQAESNVNTLTVQPATLNVGANWFYVMMKTSDTCFTIQTNIDSVKVERSAITGIVDPANPDLIIDVYPNPFRNEINVRGLDAGKLYLFTLVNAAGQPVHQLRTGSTGSITLKLPALGAGQYFLNVYDARENRLIGSAKLVRN